MKSHFAICMSLVAILLTPAFSQQSATSIAACTFADGKQLSVQYEKSASVQKVDLTDGKLWMPGAKPMLLFTQADLSIGTTRIPVGAYRLYLIPGKDRWTLVINKNVNKAEYDQQQDLLRVPMDVGQLSAPEQFSLVFAHLAPKQCNMRIYDGKIGAWAEFHEK